MSTHDRTRSTAAELIDELAAGTVTSVELTEAHLDRIDAVDGAVHAFLHVDRDGALLQAAASDERRERGEARGPLDGVPIAVKDVLATRGLPTTCGSKILEGWIPPYDATVVERLRAAGLPILGKTNMDEFAMGSSTEHSAYGPTRNPWDLDRIPGGSGGGSAAAVAAFEAPLAIGTDTGGSIRQPGAVTGTVGVKPTYGGVSRYGLVALANSLDQAGPMARSAEDCALLLSAFCGPDLDRDSTSLDRPAENFGRALNDSLDGLRIGRARGRPQGGDALLQRPLPRAARWWSGRCASWRSCSPAVSSPAQRRSTRSSAASSSGAAGSSRTFLLRRRWSRRRNSSTPPGRRTTARKSLTAHLSASLWFLRRPRARNPRSEAAPTRYAHRHTCLLYTSDAADE